MVNSLDLDPEWGAIDLLEEVEETFGIKLANEEAERCETVGDLYQVLCTKTPDWDVQSGKCASSMTFYRIRRSLDPIRTDALTPKSPLVAREGAIKLLKKISQDTALRLPSARPTAIGVSGGLVFTGGLLVAIITLMAGLWIVSGFAAIISVLGMPLMWIDRGYLPSGISTVGDLVRRTAPLNTRILKEAGGRPSDRWAVLVTLAAVHGVLTPDEIAPETFFHRRSLELATAA